MKNEILAQLGADHPWAAQIKWHESLASTNDLAKELAAQGAPHGTLILADRQSGGRGRMGRSFLSPGGMGIYLSLLLRPAAAPQELMHLTCAAAVAACEAIEEATGLRPGIKWTNDLVSGDKKLGGILTELTIKDGKVDHAIIGIGINCLQQSEELDPSIRDFAASLAMVTGKRISRSTMAAALIRALRRMDEALLCDRKGIMDRYRESCITPGKQISIHRADSVSHGLALDVDDEGGLLVRLADGTQETVNSGEVSVRGMYGYMP